MRLAALVALALLIAPTIAQDAPELTPEIEKLIHDGQTAALETRLGGVSAPITLEWTARCWVNAALRSQKPAEREERLAEAEKRFRHWIHACETARNTDEAVRAVSTAAARMALARYLTHTWAGPDIDELEVSSGGRGDAAKAVRLLELAVVELEKSATAIRPLAEDIGRYEDALFAAELYDTALRLRFEAPFHLARARIYIAQFEPKDAEKRAKALRSAELGLQQLIATAPDGGPLQHCRIALGLVFREQRRYEDAERELRRAISAEGDPLVAVQAQFELGRAQAMAGRFAEARTTLAPLAARSADSLSEEERGALFYFNCAKLWDALSYLQEADSKRRGGGGSAVVAQQADQLRATGTARLGALGAMGGPWPAIVQHYVLASVDVDADPKTLDPQQLLFVAQRLAEQDRAADAAARLAEAASRPLADLELRGRILFELGLAQHRLNSLREAAIAFETLAAQIRSHSRAPQAASNAFTLWARVADQSREKADYERLAGVLLNLVQSYPDHERRLDAAWWLPVALQAAGRYSEAVEQFGNVPQGSPHWEEAQFRRVQCARQEIESLRDTLEAAAYATRATTVAQRLREYATAAQQRSSSNPAAGAGSARWAAEARIAAAELLSAPGLEQHQPALESLADFERAFDAGTVGELIGRVLAARIRAYRGLRQFEQAARTVQQYLEAVPVEKAGPVLTLVAQGMQEELERLRRDGKQAEARRLAAEAVPTFQELERWCQRDPARANDARIVALGLAGMHYTAGQYEEALGIIDRLLAADANNGNYRRLHALILTERADQDVALVEIARSAWSRLLSDPALRTKSPERYWEARYQLLRLSLRLGHSAEVETAIRQERVWFPEMGGSPWKQRFEALYGEASAASPPPATAPAGGSK